MIYYNDLKEEYKNKMYKNLYLILNRKKLNLNCITIDKNEKQFTEIDTFVEIKLKNTFWIGIKKEIVNLYNQQLENLTSELSKRVENEKSNIQKIKRNDIYDNVNKDIYDLKEYKDKINTLESCLNSFKKNNVKKMSEVYNIYSVLFYDCYFTL